MANPLRNEPKLVLSESRRQMKFVELIAHIPSLSNEQQGHRFVQSSCFRSLHQIERMTPRLLRTPYLCGWYVNPLTDA